MTTREARIVLWKQADAILARSLELTGAERRLYVKRACAEDAELRSIVETLLQWAENEDPFLDHGRALAGPIGRELAADAAAPSQSEPDRVGHELGHYEIVRSLGRGGMGEVYEALDTRLHRRVAVKILPRGLAGDAERRARFEREARSVAALQHPNIVTVHAIEEADDELFLVMELVDGQPLDQRIPAAGMEIKTFLEVAIPLAEAVAAAHARGITHRDLKPANVLLDAEGRVRVLDFGLAKLGSRYGLSAAAGSTLSVGGDETLTGEGQILGTIAYMSPEQAEGKPVDPRSDIFSLGVVLYEMATGRRPFQGDSNLSLLSSILRDEPRSVTDVRRDLPRHLGRVIRRCLHKDPARRYQSALDLKNDMVELREEQASGDVRAVADRSVAVLPFVNLSADPENEYFADGITEDVIAHLAKIRSLKVISRTSVMAFKNSDQSLREISEKLGVATLLEGSVRRAGNRVRIVAQLIDGASDEHLWAETYDRDLTDIFAIQTDVALNITSALSARLSNDERIRVRRWPTEDLDAYELYLRGRSWYYRFTPEGLRRSLDEFERAVARDPGFALAHASIAYAHADQVVSGAVGIAPEESIRRAREAAARALALDDQLAEAHGAAGLIRMIADFDWEGAERDLLKAIELSPGNSEVHYHYGWLCGSLERHEDALREVRRGRELDPLTAGSDVTTALLRAGRLDEALAEARRAIEEYPEYPRCLSSLGWVLVFRGEHAEGIAALERAVDLAPGATMFLSQLGQALALTGAAEEARRILEKLREMAGEQFVSPYHFAYVHAGLGEADAAIDWLERAFECRSGAIYGIKGSFLFRSLHGHPRFDALLRKLNLSPSATEPTAR